MTNRTAVAVVAIAVAAGLLAGGAALDAIQADGPAVTGDVQVLHSTMHKDRVGRPTVVGEVVNGRATALAGVQVEVTFLADGETVATVTGSPVATPVPAGERMPFSVRANEVSGQPDDFRVSVAGVETNDGPVYGGLVVTEQRVDDEAQDQLFVTGEVDNQGDQRADVLVVATFYGENGSVVGVRRVRPSPATLEPGEAGAFKMRFRTLGNVPSRAREFESVEVRAVKVG